MAEVVNNNEQVGWTVIMLNNNESKALTNMLELHVSYKECSPRLGWPVLDELTNKMLGASND